MTKQTAEDQYKDIDELTQWEHNPRFMNDSDKTRLKNQLRELGQYKPLIVTEEKEVIGGNMRLTAMREIRQEDGEDIFNPVWCAVVHAPTRKQKTSDYEARCIMRRSSGLYFETARYSF